jgi:hypothetical protein
LERSIRRARRSVDAYTDFTRSPVILLCLLTSSRYLARSAISICSLVAWPRIRLRCDGRETFGKIIGEQFQTPRWRPALVAKSRI